MESIINELKEFKGNLVKSPYLQLATIHQIWLFLFLIVFPKFIDLYQHNKIYQHNIDKNPLLGTITTHIGIDAAYVLLVIIDVIILRKRKKSKAPLHRVHYIASAIFSSIPVFLFTYAILFISAT